MVDAKVEVLKLIITSSAVLCKTSKSITSLLRPKPPVFMPHLAFSNNMYKGKENYEV